LLLPSPAAWRGGSNKKQDALPSTEAVEGGFATGCLARLDNRGAGWRSGAHEHRALSAAPGVSRRRAPSQLQRRGARARVLEDRLVDIVAEGYDAGVRLSESIERDMVQVRLTDPFRFVVVGAPSYLERHGTPERPEDLLRHECITFRSQTTGALYAWELERGRRSWRVPVRGGVVGSDARLNVSLAEQGLGLSYAFEPMVLEQLRAGRLVRVLERY